MRKQSFKIVMIRFLRVNNKNYPI